MSRHQIGRLAEIAKKPTRTILGLMSGTSLDGLDLALCTFSAAGWQTEFQVDAFKTVPFTQGFRDNIRSVFAKDSVSLEDMTLLHAEIGREHARLIRETLTNWGHSSDDVDLIASHGQTVYHAPASFHGHPNRPDATLQLGDGDHIARLTGIITLSDFRQKHIAAGGEGAPLAAYGDLLLFTDQKDTRILLNMGGIANYTYLPPRGSQNTAYSTDVGPGNTLLDAYVRKHFPGLLCDKDAAIAKKGQVQQDLLADLLLDPFFNQPIPKTTGPEHFSLERFEQAAARFGAIDHADALATLTQFSAHGIAHSIARLEGTPDIFVSGGGAHNPLLMALIKGQLKNHTVLTTRDLGLDPDAKEAVLFAALANETLAGNPHMLDGRILGAPAVSMGKISLPL